MKKLIVLIWVTGILLTLSLMFNDANAQTKKNISKRTEISTSAPTKAIEINGVILDIYDLKGQLDNLTVLRLSDEAKGLNARDPEMTLIKDESLGEGAYRLAETLEEASRQADGIAVLKLKYSTLEHNMRTKFN
jgi:hypothetical protein